MAENEAAPARSSSTRVETAPLRPRRRWPWVLGLGILVVPTAIVALWTWITLSFAYSTGERAGYVQKLSRKGWICKTWEGELAMANLPGAMPEIFKFSVRDDAVAAHLTQTMGQRVSISYAQHRGIPTSCFGETEYFVTDTKAVGQP